MHYYQWNIGDYASHTSRLSLLEDLAYRRLLDLYYLQELPFNGCSTDVARDIGMQEHQTSVDYILNKFFPKQGEEWINNRANKEISIYQRKIKSAKAAGKASGEARRLKASERTLNKPSTDVEPTNNHKPITNNHKPIKDKDHSATNVTPNKVISLWNDLMNGTYARQKKVVTDTLKQTIRSRCKNEFTSINDWTKYFEAIKRSDFLMGKTHSEGRKPFQISLEWVVKPANMAKIIEGAYHS